MAPRSQTDPELSDLAAMFAEMEQAQEIVQPSDFWTALNARNLSQLDDEG